MRDRFLRSTLTVAVAWAAVGASSAPSPTSPGGGPVVLPAPATVGGQVFEPCLHMVNNNEALQLGPRRHVYCVPAAVTQQGVYPYDYARVPAAPVLARRGRLRPDRLGIVQGELERFATSWKPW